MSPEKLGFLQLCADRRFHRMTMEEFEERTGLGPDQYWIEATAGGAPGFEALTMTAAFAYDNGATVMGWAAHGDACGGFPGLDNASIEKKLGERARRRMEDYPDCEHWTLFAAGGRVGAERLSSSRGG